MGRELEGYNYITLSFRGHLYKCGKQTLALVPYIRALLESECEKKEVDDNGYILIDEYPDRLFRVVDYYRGWLQSDQPKYLDVHASRGLYTSIAERMGFEQEFIKALLTPDFFDPKEHEDELFKCYYCQQIFIHGEKEIRRE